MKHILASLMLVLAPLSLCHADNTLKPDSYYMQLAIQQAKQNPQGPFGTVIIDSSTGRVLCKGLDTTKKAHNPTLHGEMSAINNCARKYPHMDWSRSTLYTTAEPCPMCQGAIIWSGIPRVVFGTSIQELQKRNWLAITIRPEQLNSYAKFYKGTVTGGVLAKQTDRLFFRG